MAALHAHLIPDMPTATDLLPWLQQIDANRWYSNYGPLVQAFEQGLCQRLQTINPTIDFALTTLATGYHALELGLRVLDLPTNASVLIPDVTFPACPLAAHHAGLTPLLVDVDTASWQLTPAIARAVAHRHKLAAIMPVAIYGVPVDAAAWDDFTQDTGIPVLIDAAAAFESQPLPRHCLVAHSFHATKPFGIGEGGALLGQPELIAHAKCLSHFGTANRIAHSWGMNAKLSEYHAAVGLAQLNRWEGIKTRRAALLAQYQTALATMPCRWQHNIAQAIPSLLVLDCAPHPAWTIINHLQQQGIATHQTYLPPLYHHPAFTHLQKLAVDGSIATACPHAEHMAAHLVGLPFHHLLSPTDITVIAAHLQKSIA